MAKQAKAVAKSQKTVQKKPAGKPVQATKAASSPSSAKKVALKTVAGKAATPPAKGALRAATRAVKAVGDQVAKKIPSVLKSAPAKAEKATPAKSAGKPSAAKVNAGFDSAKVSAAPKAAEKKASAVKASAVKASAVKASAVKAAVVQTQKAAASSSSSSNGKPLTVGTKSSPLVKGKVVGARSSGRLSRQDAGDVCRELACEMLATSATYCRMHYIKNWKRIKAKEVLLQEGKLDRYIGELVAKYPDKYLESIRQDLQSDRDFLKVVRDLEIVDTSLDEDEAAADSDSSTEAEPYMGSMRRDFVAEDADF
jgi:hypothetical protein